MSQIAKKSRPEENQLLFLPGVFNETLGLLFDAHQYFQTRGADDQSLIPLEARPVYAHEMTRVTMRLTSVMAWIMVRRAVYAGRIEEEKASDSYRLDGAEVCLEHHPDILSAMPHYLGYLSDRSHELYQRVHRLDQMAYGESKLH